MPMASTISRLTHMSGEREGLATRALAGAPSGAIAVGKEEAWGEFMQSDPGDELAAHEAGGLGEERADDQHQRPRQFEPGAHRGGAEGVLVPTADGAAEPPARGAVEA